MDRKEIVDLIASWLIISLAFAIALLGIGFDVSFFIGLLALAITAGIGFLLHELAHKYVARYFGYHAVYQANYSMLLLALGISVLGVVFAAPGAVMIQGPPSRKKVGIIAFAGPFTNIVLALLFLAFYLTESTFKGIWGYGFLINGWLALFNMLPFGEFDGKKILAWNKIAYGTLAFASFMLLLVGIGFKMF